MNFILETWEGLRTSRLGNTTFLHFHPSFNSPGVVSSKIFSAALRDRAQEAIRRHRLRSTELVFSWAWSARKQHPIFQTGSSLWRKNIHRPTSTPDTSEYLQKCANTLSAQISWCFLLGTLQYTMFRCNFDDPRVGGIPWYVWHSLCWCRESTYWESYRDKQDKGCAFPLSNRYQWRENKCIPLIRKQLSGKS